MAKIEWNDRFLLGLGEIDQHHRHLVDLLAKTHEEFSRGLPDLEGTLSELASYADYHFKSEERWMVMDFYPEAEAHKREHQLFIDRLNEFRNDSGTSRSQYRSLNTIVFLEGWITDHILDMDATLGAYLSKSWNQLKKDLK